MTPDAPNAPPAVAAPHPPGVLHGRRILVTAGPTHEPIDAVRFLGNRSSGRVGIEISRAAAMAGAQVRLLLGPSALTPHYSQTDVIRFQSTADLERLLIEHQPWCDGLVMAAAVADFRPVVTDADLRGKWKRERGGPVTLELAPTPDLLAGCAARRAAAGRGTTSDLAGRSQLLVGFALEPRESLLEAARGKLSRKGIDYIVANPLESMEGGEIRATIVGPSGALRSTGGAVSKEAFGTWFVDWLATVMSSPTP